jgi:hypothetical protein
MFRYVFTLLFHIAVYNLAFPQSTNWEKVKESNRVTVYTCSVPGSDFNAFKAITEVNAPIDRVEAALRDINTYDEWYDQVSHGEKLSETRTNTGYCYVIVDLPWPAKDRDNIFKYKWIIDNQNGTRTLTSHAVPDYLPRKEDCIRIEQTDSIWRLTLKGPNRVEIYHEVYADPGGQLPAWIVNSFLVDGPVRSLSRLRERVEK